SQQNAAIVTTTVLTGGGALSIASGLATGGEVSVGKGLLKSGNNSKSGNNVADGVKLGKRLASEQQTKETGTTMAGAGHKRKIDDEERLVKVYGGDASSWTKKSSSTYSSKDGKIIETHWYEKDGIKYEMKTKITPQAYQPKK
ncbi:MAG: hypothetical protein ACK6BZ_06055, partial [Candidatus Kapaibacterium sp.]